MSATSSRAFQVSAIDQIFAGPAVDHVGASSASEGVGARAGVDGVVAEAVANFAVPAKRLHRVIASKGIECVAQLGAREHVV